VCTSRGYVVYYWRKKQQARYTSERENVRAVLGVLEEAGELGW